jgi:hypothetical protein
MSAWGVVIYAMEQILIYIDEARIGLKEIEAAIRILELFDDVARGTSLELADIQYVHNKLELSADTTDWTLTVDSSDFNVCAKLKRERKRRKLQRPKNEASIPGGG